MAQNLARNNRVYPTRRAVPPVDLTEQRRSLTWRWASIAAAMVFGFLVIMGARFLAHMPRERAQRNYNFAERVWYGAKMASRMMLLHFRAAPDPFPNTKLPVLSLEIGADKVAALDSDLPKSAENFQPATISFDGKSFPVQARYSGVSVNHWGMPWKSWGIKIEGGAFHGMSNLNLMMPRAETQFENWLGNEMSRRIGGFLVPDSEFVHLRVNGELNGVRLLQEPVTQEFLKRRSLPPGKIFHGDVSPAQIYEGVRRERLFSERQGWELASPFKDDQSRDELNPLIHLVQRTFNPYDFASQLPKIVEADSLLRYMALLEIVSSVHIDETHNWKLYLNPQTKRFSPIVWNSVAYYWKNTKSLDLAPNDLFQAVLANPELREAKDHLIWDAINGPLKEQELEKLITSEVDRIKADMYASALKWEAGDRGIRLLSNADWDEAISRLIGIIQERHAYLRRELSATDARFHLQGTAGASLLGIEVNSRSGIEVDQVALQLSEHRAGLKVGLTRRGLADIKQQLNPARTSALGRSAPDGVVTIALNDTLMSKRKVAPPQGMKVVPSTYVYELALPKGVSVERVLSVLGKNSVTGESYALTENSEMKIPSVHTPNVVYWRPREFVATTQAHGKISR